MKDEEIEQEISLARQLENHTTRLNGPLQCQGGTIFHTEVISG